MFPKCKPVINQAQYELYVKTAYKPISPSEILHEINSGKTYRMSSYVLVLPSCRRLYCLWMRCAGIVLGLSMFWKFLSSRKPCFLYTAYQVMLSFIITDIFSNLV